jgi:hypothetical protein
MIVPKDPIKYKEYCEKRKNNAIKQWANNSIREKMIANMIESCKDPERRKRIGDIHRNKIVSQKTREKMSIYAKNKFKDQNEREKLKKAWTPEKREEASNRTKKLWENEEYRNNVISNKKYYRGEENPNYGKRGILSPIFGRTQEKCPNWKGDKVGYSGVHMWVRLIKGTPNTCEHCGRSDFKSKQINWANKDHLYKRNLDDYMRLCIRCHRKYDIEHGLVNYKVKKRKKHE